MNRHQWSISTTLPCTECATSAIGVTADSWTFCIACLDDPKPWFPIGRMTPHGHVLLNHALRCSDHQ